jgi:hypothetical protein
VAGVQIPAIASMHPLYDPTNARIRVVKLHVSTTASSGGFAPAAR